MISNKPTYTYFENDDIQPVLQAATNTLLLNASFVDNPGLLHGKMGISICFFHLARQTGNPIYEAYAGELIDEIYDEITADTPVDFENGLAGIGWCIEYLVQEGFIEADTDEVLEEFDNKIFKELIYNPSKKIGLLNGFVGLGVYFLKRLQNSSSSDEKISTLTNKQVLIHFIDELEDLTVSTSGIIDEPLKGQLTQTPKSLTRNQSTVDSQVKSKFIFDITWEYPILLVILTELHHQNLLNFKVEKIAQFLIDPLISKNNFPGLHSNRLLLALALTRLLKIIKADQITPGHSYSQSLNQSNIELIIDNLLEKINRNTIESELPPGDITIRHGISGIAWIYMQLHRLEGGNHFRDEMGYWIDKLLLHKDKESLLTRHFNEGDNIFGVLEGLAGIMLLTKSFKKEALKQ